MRFFSRKENTEARALTPDSLPSSLVSPTVAALEVNGRTALGLADVFACVRALSDGAVLCPLKPYRDTDQGRVPVTGGKGPQLLRAPSPGVTQSMFVAELLQHCATWGEAFIGKVRDADGSLIQLEALSPDRVTVKLVNGEPIFTYFAPLGPVFDNLTTADVIHIRGMVAPDGLRGASPISLCREALGLASSLTTASSALWANGAVPAGVLTVPPGAMAEDNIANLSEAWAKRHQGPKSTGRIAVVSGDVQFQSVTMPLTDAEFIETRRLSTAEIARIFRVPVSMIGGSDGSSMTYRNTVDEAMAFQKFALGPWLRLIEDAISADQDILPGVAVGVEFDFDALLRADIATRAAVYTQALAAGWLTVDEVREREGMGPMPAGESTSDAGAVQFAQALSKTNLVSGSVGG